MIVIFNNEETTEKKNNSYFECTELFKVIKKTSKLIETFEEEQYIGDSSKEEFDKDIKYINRILDKISNQIIALKTLKQVKE